MLRTLAVYGRDRRMAGLFILLAVGAIILTIVCVNENPTWAFLTDGSFGDIVVYYWPIKSVAALR